MSAAQNRWDDPYRTGFAGRMYDPGTMYGLYFRAQAGDLAAKNHLAQNGFFDAQGNDVFGAGQNYQQAVSNWANSRGLSVYNGANPFQWNSAWAYNGAPSAAPGFQQAWDQFYSNARVDQPTPNTPPKTDPMPSQNGPPQVPTVGTLNGFLGAGAGSAQAPQGGPDWARFTAGNTGASFSNIAKSFDPWGNWGQYGPNQANAPKRHQYAQGMESDIDRVYRWTNDILRSQGYSGGENAPPQLRTQIFLANVERLRQEYKNNNLDWNSSAFADMERGEASMRVGGIPGAPPAGGQPAAGGQQQPSTPATPPPAADPTQGLPTGYHGGNAGTSGNLTAAQRLAISSDPDQAYRYMMQQLGYNPSAPGLLGNFLKQRFQPLLEARMGAAGVSDNANYMDQIDQIVNQFGGQLFQKGGNFFGDLRNIGTQAAGQAAPFLNGLQDQNQAMQYMNQLGMLRYAGSNPLVQQSIADEMQRGREEYQDLSFNNELTGKGIDPFQQWLQQSRYRNYFGY